LHRTGRSDDEGAGVTSRNRRGEPKGGLLGTRGRKIGAAIGAAFLAGIGGGIAAWVTSTAESTTTRAPIEARVARPGTFFSGAAYGPYYVMPTRDGFGPNAIGRAELARMAKAEDFLDAAWDVAHGGVAGSPQVVRLEVRGTTDEPVIITAIRVRVLRRGPPVKGWYVVSPACGAVPVRVAEIDLDEAHAPVGYYEANGNAGPRALALSVSRTNAEQIELHASTRTARVTWEAEVYYSGPTGDGSLVVADAGKPFEVTSETASAGYSPPNAAGPARKLRREHSWDGHGISAC
jgi:hypothetical protein